MGSSTVVLIAVVVVVLLGGLFVFTTSARRDRAAALARSRQAARDEAASRVSSGETASSVSGREVERAAVLSRRGGSLVVVAPGGAPPAPRAPMDPEALGVTRRQLFNRSIVGFFTLGLTGFGAASIGFLWPTLSGGFGAKIKVGKLDEILGEIRTTREPFYLAEARTWIAPYPTDAVGKASKAYNGAVLGGMKEGVVALYQKCVHLGCRVPYCKSSQWFECPCHGSKYNRVGEKKAGPAPRGLDRFGVEISGGVLSVDTSTLIQGPPIGTNTTGQEAEGPHCA
ncbi:MAG TPA: Rieske 2Fe-2S domain-containing protein [Acidimicrobiales bacterium]|nr:Rieske 2Fe-2S domain-containing protein [Acidimicrobiales bacterium]